jgi:RHS repeat-associated protein
VAADAAAYSLHFFTGDYQAIESQTSVQQFTAGQGQISNVAQAGPDLNNGNISRMVTTITDIDPGNSITDGTALPLLMVYQYDQLNRIREARSYGLMDAANNQWQTGTIAASGDYYNKLTYDANGNILTQQRNGVGAVIDNLTYNYTTRGNGFPSHRTNQLRQVTEDAALADCSFADDINKNQQTNNYIYDAIGNLVVDKQNYIYGANDASGAIPGIVWNSYGKIASITKDNTAGKYIDCNGNGIQDVGENSIVLQDLEFHYDADGQRICKIVKPHAATGGVKPQADWIYTYYLRDPQGTVLNVYERRNVNSTAAFTLEEQYVYGAARTGMVNRYVNLLTAGAPGSLVKRKVGEKVYEIANHLGNVITTLNDRRNAVDANTDGAVDCFKAVVMSVTDYSAFGVPLAERTYNAGAYRYSMNGQEKEDDLGSGVTTAEYWMYDAKLGRRWNVDPVIKPFRSGYDAFSNNPVNRVDPNGDDDFFNAQGLYLFSTPTGNNIRIITSVNWHLFISIPRPPYLPTITNELQIKYAVENSVLLEDYYWRNIPTHVPKSKEIMPDGTTVTIMEEKKIVPQSVNLMFSRIMEYYANQIGLPLGIYGGVHTVNNDFYAITQEEKIFLGIVYETATKVSLAGIGMLSNSNNLKNILVHEHQHYKDQHFGNSSGRNGVLRHLDIYLYQIKDKTWLNTTKDFRNALYKNIRDYLHDLTKESDVITEIKRFNEALGRNVFVYDSKTKAIKTNYE